MVRLKGVKKGLKIDSSAIGMESARTYQSTKATMRRFVIKDYQGALANSGNSLNTAVKDYNEGNVNDGTNNDEANTSKSADAPSVNEWQNRFGVTATKDNIRQAGDNTISNIRQLTIRYIFDLLFSARRNRFREMFGSRNESINNINSGSVNGSWQEGTVSGAQSYNQALTMLSTNMRVLNYTSESYEWEQESTSFSTVGTVRTSDGREINFNVNVGMSREFEQYYGEDVEVASFNLCDPLVINLDTDVASLDDQTFYFDIDADGELDEISNLGAGSGYLALDKNDDGVINDGSELFGTSSGNGFKDLAQYDDDGNGWIDENDKIWSKLKIWVKDADGDNVLYSLADKGVGAICLQNAATDFSLKGDDGHTKGAIRNTGIFLYENGNVGTVQHVDVAKYSNKA